jgi:hypothetical protein
MSTGRNCFFLKNPRSGEWFYVLQDWDCPTAAWDWREYATAYGPFTATDEAEKHLREKHANPGGSHYTTPEELDDVQERLVLEAKAPKQESYAERCRRTGRGDYWNRRPF